MALRGASVAAPLAEAVGTSKGVVGACQGSRTSLSVRLAPARRPEPDNPFGAVIPPLTAGPEDEASAGTADGDVAGDVAPDEAARVPALVAGATDADAAGGALVATATALIGAGMADGAALIMKRRTPSAVAARRMPPSTESPRTE
jgi:hypothetical protein